MGCSSSSRSFLSSQKPGSHLPWVFHLTCTTLLALATCALQRGEVPSQKEGFRKFQGSSMWESPPLCNLCELLHWSIPEQQVSPDEICCATPSSQMELPGSPHRDKHPRQRERAFPQPFRSSLPSALLGAVAERGSSCVCSALALQSLAPIPNSCRARELHVIAQNGGEKQLGRSRCFTFWKWEVFRKSQNALFGDYFFFQLPFLLWKMSFK